jgi:hypothetical protein
MKGLSAIFHMKAEDATKNSDNNGDKTIGGNKEKKKVREDNRKSYHLLVSSINSDSPRSIDACKIVRLTQTDDFPHVSVPTTEEEVLSLYGSFIGNSAPNVFMVKSKRGGDPDLYTSLFNKQNEI